MNIELKESDKLFEALNDLDFIEIVHDKPKEGDFQIKVKSKSWLEKKIGYNCIATYNHENNEITSHEKLSINEGAIRAWPRNNGQYSKYLKALEEIATKNKFSLETPIKDLNKKQIDLILNGNKDFLGIIKLSKKELE